MFLIHWFTRLLDLFRAKRRWSQEKIWSPRSWTKIKL